MRLIWCSMPRIGGRPGGRSCGKTSWYCEMRGLILGCKGVTSSLMLFSSINKARTCFPLVKALSTCVSLNMRRSLFFSLPTPGIVLWTWFGASGLR